ncbi:CGLD27-like [Dillenia turbinata]|uniref:CGLD27-like n=1 Tax=Dillenia turbinata TaxID=194707 RepID=A0AAN8V1F6_9MAGN
MLRLNICCSVIPKQVKSGARYGSWITPNHGPRNAYLRISVKALSNEKNGGSSGYSERSWDPGLEIEVPFEQRPVNEYSSLKDETLYSWGDLSPRDLFIRLGGLWLVTFTVLGVPVAAASFDPAKGRHILDL